MMCKAVQAYVQQRPGSTGEALDLAERMPEGCLQRNEAYMAIAASSTDLQEARLVIDRLNHFQYYAIAVKDLCLS